MSGWTCWVFATISNLLDATELTHKSPKLYATLLLWLMAELFEQLPEVGNPDVPKLVFFFDEAHLLFSKAPKALLEKITQVVRLIRSKGVGVYFVTQNPLDIPDAILGQLAPEVASEVRAMADYADDNVGGLDQFPKCCRTGIQKKAIGRHHIAQVPQAV